MPENNPQTLQLTLIHTTPYHNQYLFSDHYLDHLLPQDPRWEAVADATPAFLAWVQDRYAQEQAHLDAYNESQLEEHWFKPIFERLGHVYEPQASVPGLGQSNVKKPDYVFFPTEADRQAAVGLQKTEDYAARALAVGEVKQWDVNLSKKVRGGGIAFDSQNPSYQIDYYLKATGVNWGILSNGRRWRLVHRESSYRLDVYYEVDLVELIARSDVDALRYFVLFFQPSAFQPDAQGHVFLDDVLAGSHAYAVALEEDLQENAYRALERLMQGFLDLTPNALGEEDLRDIYDNSLYLLYRLLFILYGESRGVLPIDNERYRVRYSLQRIKAEIADLLDKGEFVSRFSTIYWWLLENLFHLINGDDPEFNEEVRMVRYNGGLFDPAMHPFLAEKRVGDRALITAIDLLSRRETETGKEFADYRTLGIRHLGSIYEGLLEYQPRLATEQMVAVRDSKGERWVPVAKAPQGAKRGEYRDAGQIYLETDKGERKATGSYYTPQYIVQYIVEETLGPLLKEWKALKSEKAKKRESEKTRKRKCSTQPPNDPTQGQRFVEKVLSLKVLDPSMGSGHFLVEATDYLARVLATDPYVETDMSDESDLNYWRRRVVERCIYGVDKNSLAVELAKLSLWLNTFAGDKPLGFLDHHLKCGDSLVGADADALGNAPPPVLDAKHSRRVAEGQMNMFAYLLSQQLPVVMGKVLEIVGRESDSYDTVRAKEAANRAVQQLKAPFVAVANLWTSAYFGHTYTPGDYQQALNLLHTPEALFALPAVQQAEALAAERHFFHWELTFPEVFFDQHGQPLPEDAWGFDAVIGNPPYDVLICSEQGEEYIDYVNRTFEAAQYNPNLFALFIELGIELVRHSGYFSLIVPNVWLSNQMYTNTRELVITKTTLKRILDFEFTVFDEIIPTSIFVMKKERPLETASVTFEYEITNEEKFPLLYREVNCSELKAYIQPGWGAFLSNAPNLLRLDISVPLSELFEVYRGVETRDNSTYLSLEKRDSFDCPILEATGVTPYHTTWEGTYVRFVPEELKSNADITKYEVPCKVLLRRTGDRLIASVDREQYLALKNLYVLISKSEVCCEYLCSLLNSRLLNWERTRFTRDQGQAFAQLKGTDVEQLPIRHIAFTTPETERAALLAEAIALYEAKDTRALLTFTATRLTAEPEQADVIHDLLAYLAEQMIILKKEKQARIAKFWTDMEGVSDLDTFAKLQKGKQGRTLWKAKACRPFVEEGSYTTYSLEQSLAWSAEAFKAFVRALAGTVKGLSDLIEVYNDYAPRYAQQVQRIAATDHLIDQIVYQLYGLTAEEIAIVEGKGEEL